MNKQKIKDETIRLMQNAFDIENSPIDRVLTGNDINIVYLNLLLYDILPEHQDDKERVMYLRIVENLLQLTETERFETIATAIRVKVQELLGGEKNEGQY